MSRDFNEFATDFLFASAHPSRDAIPIRNSENTEINLVRLAENYTNASLEWAEKNSKPGTAPDPILTLEEAKIKNEKELREAIDKIMRSKDQKMRC